jgi:hypothetical protein
MSKITVFSTLLLVLIVGASACSSLAPSTVFSKSEVAEGLAEPEFLIKNDSEYSISVTIRGDIVKELSLKDRASTTCKVPAGSYSIMGRCPDAMPTSVYIRAEPNRRYNVIFHLGMK